MEVEIKKTEQGMTLKERAIKGTTPEKVAELLPVEKNRIQ